MRSTSNHLAHAALAVLLTLAAPTPARAQFWPQLTDKEKQGRFRLGPLALTPRLELRNAGIDTNVYVAPADPTRDTAVVLRASADAYVPLGRRVRLAGTGWLDFNYFASESEQRSTDPGAQGRVELDAWRLTFVGGGGGFHARQLYSIDIDERIRRSEQFANGGVRLRLSSTVTAEGGIEGRQYHWDPTLAQGLEIKALLDHDSTTLKGGLRYRLTPLSDLIGTVEKIDDTFVYASPEFKTTTSYRYLGGFEFGRKAVVSGRFLGGVRTIPADKAGSVEPYTGPAFQAAIAAPLMQRLRLGLGYARDVYYSAEAARSAEGAASRNTFTYDQLHGTLDVDTVLDLVVRFTGGYESSRYLRPSTVAGPDGPTSINRTDHVTIAGFSLLRRLGDSALLGVSAIHTSRDSNDPNGGYSRWQYGIQGSVTP